MSRVGKLPVALVEGVTATITDETITIKGPKGELTQDIVGGVTVKEEDGSIVVSIDTNDKKAFWGLMRALINNMVIGVTQGYEKKLQVIGVGYSAKVQGNGLLLNLGYSHPINHDLPSSVTATVDKDPKGNDMIVLQSIDKQLVGEQAAKIRAYRKPEPYKGKGVRYFGEYIKMKAGKTAAK